MGAGVLLQRLLLFEAPRDYESLTLEINRVWSMYLPSWIWVLGDFLFREESRTKSYTLCFQKCFPLLLDSYSDPMIASNLRANRILR